MSNCHHPHHCPPLDPVVVQPVQVFQPHFHPQIQTVVHPIEIINQHFCVPVPCHVYPVVVKDEVCGVSNWRGKKAQTRSVRSKKR
ncbi:hypothetical protein Q5741_03315 [Paenibacillus sp. JX-17]|uniref:Spore coat protein D n=1 Tax=Paenibacillus lacisoli TaxID=3064525 RepID=A0ABT9C996_9BACL|nr:hypothetical protein [Paenibacillus sp. JX-17]MDO7905440.1 hypothetical protein [Paenibacillus sp. JX-17]